MRNIFELTKREQRTVIVIIAALVALAFGKHWWQTKSQPVPPATTSPPASHPAKDQAKSEDQR